MKGKGIKNSFSSKVKEELYKQIGQARHCQIAELGAIISFCGRFQKAGDNKYDFKIHTENMLVARKCFTLLRKAFNIDNDIVIRSTQGNKKVCSYLLQIGDDNEQIRILQALKVVDEQGKRTLETGLVNSLIIPGICCKRAFIRGAFLAAGSISDPEKFYHLEIVCPSREKALQLRDIMNHFAVDAKVIERKKHFVVYVKEGTRIVDTLNIMEAPISLMELENLRIVKEMRNFVNRRVNCETANINKTVSAAVKQMEDIRYIQETAGLEKLPVNLQETAQLRLENPEATLKELGELMIPIVGKSGVNHRLRKISDFAERMREQRRSLE